MQERVRLLGAPRIWHAGGWRDLPLGKRLGLLTHLVCRDDWVTRERLAFLFWPDATSQGSRINLRQLLARVRALPFELALDADDQRVRWLVDSDVKAFRRALAAGAWPAALAAYGGELAAGLEPDDASEFGEWLALERSRLRESYRHAALAQAALPERPEPPREPSTPFVGRDGELSLIRERLTHEECRLLTLVGPVGVGKTRLALRAANELAEWFAGGAAFVRLVGLTAPGDIPAAIAGAVGLELRGEREPLQQVCAALAGREMLLVLDGFDHLTDGALLLGRLLAACPGVRCLVTSRERLRLQGEWLLPLAERAAPGGGAPSK